MPRVTTTLPQGRHFYSTGGRMTAATTATTGICLGCLWNPSSTVSIWFVSFYWNSTDATNSTRVLLSRCTTRGTAALTVTPDQDNDYENYVAPASGALLDIGPHTAQPTLSTPPLARWSTAAGTGENPIIMIPHRPIKIPPNAGICLTNATAVIIGIGDVSTEWYE